MIGIEIRREGLLEMARGIRRGTKSSIHPKSGMVIKRIGIIKKDNDLKMASENTNGTDIQQRINPLMYKARCFLIEEPASFVKIWVI
jgi:hypothetical protein